MPVVALIDRLLTAELVLGEGSMYERLRRDPVVRFDPEMAQATLVYDDASRAVLERTHREYLDIGQAYGVPILTATDTWRANRERQDRSLFRAHPVNQDNVRFLRGLRASYGTGAVPILIGGSVGPRGDAYRPDEALGREAAAAFHAPQVAALAEAGPDYLIGNTLPAVSEARGIADVFAATGLPYILSFVVRADGAVLDGTPLAIAIEAIDAATISAPAGYGINCVHPSLLGAALDAAGSAAGRIAYFQANASALGPDELDGRDELDADDPAALARAMHEVAARFGIRALGGCCGTGTEHLEAIARLGSSGGRNQRHADEDDAGARAL
jgi:homocysteine S-methyltransferase